MNLFGTVHLFLLTLGLALGASRELAGADTESKKDSPPSRVVKCGRDCAFLACRLLGVDADLEEIDRALAYRHEVSIADLRRVLEEKGLICRSVLFRRGNLPRLSEVVGPTRGSVAAIAMLPSREESKHFVLVVGASESAIALMDGSTGTSTVPIESLPEGTEIPVLLTGKDASVRQAFEGGGGLLERTAARVFSPWVLSAAVLLLAIALLGTRRRIPTVVSRVARATGSLAAILVRAPRRMLQSRVGRFAIISAIVAALAVFFVLQRHQRNPLVVEPEKIALGDVAAESKQVLEFRVHNRGRASQEIARFIPSCPCMQVEDGPMVVPPGESVLFRVNLAVVSFGALSYTILVVPKDNSIFAPDPVQVSLTGIEAVKIVPVYFDLGEFPQGVKAGREAALRVDQYRGPPVPLTRAESEGQNPVLSAEFVGRAELAPQASFSLRLTSSETAPLGPFWQRIFLTSGEDPPRSFVLTAYGSIVAPATFEPRSLFLGRGGARDDSGSQTVRIRSLVAPFQVVSTASKPEVLKVEVRPQAGSNREVVLRVSPAVEPAKLPPSAFLTVVTTCAQLPRIEIPVYFSSALRKP